MGYLASDKTGSLLRRVNILRVAKIFARSPYQATTILEKRKQPHWVMG